MKNRYFVVKEWRDWNRIPEIVNIHDNLDDAIEDRERFRSISKIISEGLDIQADFYIVKDSKIDS